MDRSTAYGLTSRFLAARRVSERARAVRGRKCLSSQDLALAGFSLASRLNVSILSQSAGHSFGTMHPLKQQTY